MDKTSGDIRGRGVWPHSWQAKTWLEVGDVEKGVLLEHLCQSEIVEGCKLQSSVLLTGADVDSPSIGGRLAKWGLGPARIRGMLETGICPRGSDSACTDIQQDVCVR